VNTASDRVTPVRLDVTDHAAVRAVAAQLDDLDVLVNNAGLSLPDDLADRRSMDEHLAVNLFGTFEVTSAFVPHLTRTRGALVNVLSLAAIAPVPVLPSYAVSKAAVASLTQSQRALLRSSGVTVHGVYAGPIDTDMIRTLDIPKTPAAAVAAAIFDGVEAGAEDIFPDPMSVAAAQGWQDGTTKNLEQANEAMFSAQLASDRAVPA
jgi:NAD(P)-dependent dehydrogenase (short-subunit alcohol dehydrogenase family)